ncbi:MAG TPA: FAD-dependent oxidoreductase, partial [bacterium]
QRIVGGSQTYVKAILKTFKKRILMGSPVDEIRRGAEQVTIKTRDGQTASFDKVVLATHADEALGLLTDPTEEEQRLLSAWSYQKNHITLHTDIDVMPPNRRAWASWNYIRELETTRSEPVSMTYHLNRLQGLKTEKPYFVTLNRVRPIPEKYILKEIFYTHPTYTREAVRSQKELPSLNGVNKTYFCGSYFGYGFHEDAVKSAVAVAQCFGMDL